MSFRPWTRLAFSRNRACRTSFYLEWVEFSFMGEVFALSLLPFRGQLTVTNFGRDFRSGTYPTPTAKASSTSPDSSSLWSSFRWRSSARTSTWRTCGWKQMHRGAATCRRWSRRQYQRWFLSPPQIGPSNPRNGRSIRRCSTRSSPTTASCPGTKSSGCWKTRNCPSTHSARSGSWRTKTRTAAWTNLNLLWWANFLFTSDVRGAWF